MATLITACSSSSTSAPTQAAYDKQANALCQTYNAKLKAMGATITSASSKQQVASELAKAVTLAKQGSAQLKALAKPAGQSAGLDKVYADQDAQVSQIQAFASALQANDSAKAQSIENALNAGNGRLNQEFDALGLTACGSGSSS